MKIITVFLLSVLSSISIFSQSVNNTHGPTDTLMFKEFNTLPGVPTILTYGYSNGNGFFFGTNFLDLDQNPQTPYEPGVQAIAQGFPLDTGKSYYILDVLVRVGNKLKGQNSSGTPLIVTIQSLDDSSHYSINTSSGTQSYTIHAPGTSLGSASIPWDSMKTGVGVNYSVAHFNTPVFVDMNFAVVIDFVDFYLNGDKVGLWCSPQNGGSNIYGQEYTLWLYPKPMLWIQVNHLYLNINRAIAVFPVVDDGTFGIENDDFLNSIKLGQSFPNPAADYVNIEYELQKPANVRLEICDASGRIIINRNEGKQGSGRHSIQQEIRSLDPGIYYYTLIAGNKHLTKKLMVNR